MPLFREVSYGKLTLHLQRIYFNLVFLISWYFLNSYNNPPQVILYGELKTEPLWGRILIKFSHFLLTISSALNIIIYSYNERSQGEQKTLLSSLSRISSSVQFLESSARNTTISVLNTNNLRLKVKSKHLRQSET